MANYSVTGTLGVQRTCIAQVGSAVAALLLAACGGGPVCTNTSTATCIGASGGTVSGPKGATVTIPDGVLPTFTTVIAIGVQPDATNSPSLPAGTSAAGLVWQLLPHGTTFTAPVTLTLPFDPTALPAGVAPRLFKAQPGGSYAEVTPIIVNGNFITAQVRSFSYFAIITNKLPTAVLNLPTGDTQTAQVLRFAATGSSDEEGALANYRWNFGDGSAVQEGATLLNPTHTFATVGNYSVSLTVTDALGASNTAQSNIRIAPICTAPQFLRRGECVSPELTDTGITASQCYAVGSSVLTSCTSAPAIALNASQDGMLGTDVTMPDAADGNLGFSYRTVPNPSGGSFAVTECVKDMLTGLTWEGKTATGMRAGSAVYTNYDNTAQAQFWNGSANVNPTQTDIDAATNAVGYKNAVNASALCGYTDWRLPSVDELQSLVDYGLAANGPTIDTTWFPNTPASRGYWTASPYVSYAWGVSFGAWGVSFYDGYVHGWGRSYTGPVRLVR